MCTVYRTDAPPEKGNRRARARLRPPSPWLNRPLAAFSRALLPHSLPPHRPLHRHPVARALLALALAPLACGGASADSDESGSGDEENGRVLTPFLNLGPASADEDPLATHRPEVIECNNLVGWYVEDSLLEESTALEVSTAECNYLSLVEASAVDALAGENLVTELSYFDLTADMPTVAHVALTLDSEILWETEIPVPSAGDVVPISITLTRDVPEGTPVGFHLHNHGQNTWNFSPLVLE